MNPKRLLICLLLLAIACTGSKAGSSGDSNPSQASKASAKDVSAPPPARADLTGRVGLVVATNSRSWAKMLSSDPGKGVVVIFVQPGGPSDSAGIEVGDVITAVGDQPVYNQERAPVLLRAKNNEKRVLKVVKRGGDKKSVPVTAKNPGPIDQIRTYTALIAREPGNPVYYYLRAQVTGRAIDEALADANRAVQLSPSFVEAITLRGETLHRKSNNTRLPADQIDQLRAAALQDFALARRLDPSNPRPLIAKANLDLRIGKVATARAEAQDAIKMDETFPQAYNVLATSNFVLGRYEEAAAPARTSIDLNPFDVRYYVTLGRVFVRLKRQDDADKTVNAIINLVPKNDEATRELLLRLHS